MGDESEVDFRSAVRTVRSIPNQIRVVGFSPAKYLRNALRARGDKENFLLCVNGGRRAQVSSRSSHIFPFGSGCGNNSDLGTVSPECALLPWIYA